MIGSKDISYDFALFVENAKYSDLSEDAIDAAKKSILDTLGVILAASGMEPAVRGIAEIALEGGGRQESSVLGFGARVPAIMAAFANGAMAHCLDFDDHAPEGHHPSSSIVPVVFALAERMGGISGKDMITAVAVGQDLFLRLRRNVGWKQDWHLTTVMGVFSATAAGAHVIGLSREQTVNAFGIAGNQASGTMELAYGVGSDLRGMYAGFTSKAAVLSVLMSQKGVTGTKSFFEGKAGLFNVYFDGQYDREKMLEGLGSVFDGGSILYKPWPSCGASHAYIHATLELMKKHAITILDIEKINVYVGDFQNQLCQPLESRRQPKTFADAKFSIPFVIALAATRGQVKVSDFTGDTLNDPEVLSAAQKVVPIFDTSFDWKSKLPEGRVEILTMDGRTLMRLGDDVPGSSETPMTWDYLYNKFEDAASLAAIPLALKSIERSQNMVRNLEKFDDATKVLEFLL
ncbi:MmgE/PrpD family protein [Halomonas sp. HK25]|uniref:MmgE/PrpD family protein n=1 Tax=Halomonas sp. HK25 TaxID=3394321 RepID=UPI0039FC9EC3